jgi:micrococcal nuclease
MSRYSITLFLTLFVCQVEAENYGPYLATVLRVIDGDSVEADVELWPGLTQRINIRLDGIDTPEMDGPQCEKEMAWRATKFTNDWVAGSDKVILSEVRPDKYGGRVLGKVRMEGKVASLGAALISAGLAREYDGGKKEKWCE